MPFTFFPLVLLILVLSHTQIQAQNAEQHFFATLDSARALLTAAPAQAVTAAERAAAEAEDDGQRLMAEELRAEAMHRAGSNVMSLSTYDYALALAERTQDAQARGRLLNRSGIVYRSLGRYDQSLTLHLRSLAIFDSLGNDLGRAQAVHDLAKTLLQLGQYDEARQNLERALKLREAEQHKEGIAESYNTLGTLFWQKGQHDSALVCFMQALSQQKLIGLHSTAVAQSLSSIGDVYVAEGEITRALESYREALSIAEEAGDHNVLTEIRMHVGRCYRLLGDLARARNYLTEARQMAQSTSLGNVLAEVLGETATLEEAAGNPVAALALYRRSVAVHDSMDALLDERRLADAEALYRKERSGMEFQDLEESRANDYLIFFLVVAVLLLILAGIALYVLRVRARGSRDLSVKNSEIHEMNARLKTLNRELAQSEEKYRLLFERLPIGVFLYDSNLQLMQINDAFVEIIGSTRDKLEGLLMRELRDARILPALESAIKGETGAYEGEYNTTTSEKVIDVSIRTTPLTWPDGNAKYGLGFVLDITNWKRIERELIEAKEMAEMADGMKHAFLTSISHEIRTPLNIIMGYFGILHMDLRDQLGSAELDHFAKIDLAVRRLLRTVDQILNLSILESGTYALNIERCLLFDMIMELVEEMRPLAEDKGLDVQLLRAYDDVEVWVDRYSIAQAMRNLLDNAIKFTDEGSIRISLDRRESVASVIIEDTGIGMSEEYIQRLYQSFSQEEGGYTRAYDGLGLGLTLTKRYVDVNEGNIVVKSRKGLGTKFTVDLPIAVDTQENDLPEEIVQSEDGHRPHVLIVEDDHETQKFLQLILETHCQMSFAETGLQAWAILEKEVIDLILMDISLRGDEDGLQLTSRIRENPAYSQLPIIAVTAHAFADDRRRSLEAGCNEYLPKPFRMKQLREIITRYTA